MGRAASPRPPPSAPSVSARSGKRPRITTWPPRIPATVVFTADLTGEVGKALVTIPTKVGALVHRHRGGQRDPQTPISVVGASIIGGDTVDHGLWVAFWFSWAIESHSWCASTLVPLLPFDGGHIAMPCTRRSATSSDLRAERSWPPR